MSKITLNQIKEAVEDVDMVSKNRMGEYVFRRGYFYRNGTPDRFAEKIRQDLFDAGIPMELTEFGDIWKPFRGGASLVNSSHFFAKFVPFV